MRSKIILSDVILIGKSCFRSVGVMNKLLGVRQITAIFKNTEQQIHGARCFHKDYNYFGQCTTFTSKSRTYFRVTDHLQNRLIPCSTFKTVSGRHTKDSPSSSSTSGEKQKPDVYRGITEIQRKDQSSKTSPLSQSVFQRFKSAYKEYGKVLICVHVVTSAVWYGLFFYAARSGIDVVPLLIKMGAGESIIKPFQSSGAGHFAIAYLLYKIATPVRYTVTIGGTQVTVRQLRNMGYMEKPSEKDSLRNLVKQGRTEMRDQVEKVKDKMEDARDNVKDKVEDVRYNVKDRMDDVRDNVKDKVGDLRGNLKDKMEDIKDASKQNIRVKHLKHSTKERLDDLKENVTEAMDKLKGGGRK